MIGSAVLLPLGLDKGALISRIDSLTLESGVALGFFCVGSKDRLELHHSSLYSVRERKDLVSLVFFLRS